MSNQFMTISKEILQGVTGGRGGHGEDKTPISGAMFKAIEKAGRIVDQELPLASHSEAERQKRFLQLRDGFLAGA